MPEDKYRRKVKFIFFDLDGTLLDDDKNIDPELLEYLISLKEKKKIRFGFATGRHIVSVEPIMERYGLEKYLDGIICNIGSDLYFPATGEHQTLNYLSVEQIDQCLERFSSFDFISTAFHNEGHKMIANRYTKEVEMIKNRNSYNRFYYPWETEYTDAPKFLLLFDPDDFGRAAEAAEANIPDGLRYVLTEPNIIEILNVNNSKALAAETVLERYGLTLDDAMFFGDSENDRQLIEAAGISVCMANGRESVKKDSDFVTELDNNHNGILDFLKKHEYMLSEVKDD